MNKLLRLLVFVLSVCLIFPCMGQDSINNANKKKIQELKSRIDKLYTIDSNPDSLIQSLKEVIRHQRDSIRTLTSIVKEKTPLNSCNCSWIYYELGKYNTDYSKYPGLDSIVSKLKTDPSLQLKLIGYADKSGENTFNQRLSLQRAKSLKEYLVNKYKIHREKIVTEGRGSKEPIKGNTDPNIFHLDRRVELYIVKP